MAEIYGLYDPDTNELRYIGKANDSQVRLKSHLADARTLKRPVCNWIRGLTNSGKLPVLKVLETVEDRAWEAAEIRLIAEHRAKGNLLNLADGGARPSQTKEQRANAARAARKAADKDPVKAKFWAAKRDMGRLLAKFTKQQDWYHVYHLRFIMRIKAAGKPEYYGDWASI